MSELDLGERGAKRPRKADGRSTDQAARQTGRDSGHKASSSASSGRGLLSHPRVGTGADFTYKKQRSC
eukprot:6086436-Alexandrium_andersonii.AAC.1